VPGKRILFSEFFEAFMESLSPTEKVRWSKSAVAQGLPPRFPRGHGKANQVYIGNISFEDVKPDPGAKPLIRVGNKLVAIDGTEDFQD
jgi:hypothetical protein